MESASAGVVETGLPLFAIQAAETIGLRSPPTHLRALPDGRMLVASGSQLAIGDGVRWEVFDQARGDEPVPDRSVAVNQGGIVYTAARQGFARVEFEPGGRWVARLVAGWPGPERGNRAIPRTCVQTGDRWIWHGSSGDVLTWQPGEKPAVIGHAASIQHVFSLAGAIYVSDRTDGSLAIASGAGMQPVNHVRQPSVDETITCSAPIDARAVLVGTEHRGVKLFDGRTTQPFGLGSVLADAVRVNDLCTTGAGFHAAAIENHGIVFFDRTGRIVQVLDRSSDQRLAHVRQLAVGPGGVVWALLRDAVAQIQFPARVSYFEPLIATGTGTAHPLRHRGDLWITADGYVRRAMYDRTQRLTELRVDTPPGRFASNTTTVGGQLVTATDHGAYFRRGDDWVPFAPAMDHLRVLDHPPVNGRWLYAATGQLGWLEPKGDRIELEPFAEPHLQKAYDSVQDNDGSVWVETGNGGFGRIRLDEGRPRLERFGTEAGLPDSWGQLFRLDGRVRFNIGDRVLRFDGHRFGPDTDFARQFPDIGIVIGRPGLDAAGRWWVTTPGGVRVFARSPDGWRDTGEKLPAGLLPYYFTFEDHGVVWMHAEQRLARYDPAMPGPVEVPLQAVITRIVLPASRREFVHPGPTLSPLAFTDRTIVLHFAAPGQTWQGVTFEVAAGGGGESGWVSAGSIGSAVFNQLGEGRHLIRVRPRLGAVIGAEATLGVTIVPPWYRSAYAYVAYWFCGVALVLASGRISTLLQRRENSRLERLVAERTRELNLTNDQLAAQVEEIRLLSQGIEQSPVAVLITDRTGGIVFANPRACQLSGRSAAELIGENLRLLRAGGQAAPLEAAIATALQRGTAWRGQLVNERKNGELVHVRSAIAPVRGAHGEVRHHLVLEEDITSVLAENEQRQRLEAQLVQAQKLESLGTLAGGIAHDFNNILTAMLGFCELAEMGAANCPDVQRDLEGIRTAGFRAKDLVGRILAFSRQSHAEAVTLHLSEPVQEAMNLIRASAPATIELVTRLERGAICADPTQIQQIVLNLGTNAIHAIGAANGRIEVTVEPFDVDPNLAAEVPKLWLGPSMRLKVTDTGCGMDQATLDRIFDPFFTTKPLGVGTGLGLAIVQSIVTGHGGAMRVHSTPQVGTTFELFFRRSEDQPAVQSASVPAPRGHDEEVMVVDDEPAVANFMAVRLRQLGYRPVVYTDPAEALDAWAVLPDRFGAIVTDLTMPALSGADLIQSVRARGRMVPAVIVTGHGSDAVRAQLKELPRSLVVPKPFSGDDLGRALAQVIGDRGEAGG